MILQRDQTFQVVFNLRTPTGPGREEVGTGIFVTKGNEAFMVTATHVARGSTPQTSVVLSDAQSRPTTLLLTGFNRSLSWQHHPIADVSVLHVVPTDTVRPHLAGRCFPWDHLHLDRTPVSRDSELTSVGFPSGLGAAGMFSPLTFRFYASSSFISLNRADTGGRSEFFLLENPSMGGYSGCPVFDLAYIVSMGMTTAGDKTRCYGIMHGTISDATGGKLALVTPCYYLAEILR